jgi:predicted dehydrogenase
MSETSRREMLKMAFAASAAMVANRANVLWADATKAIEGGKPVRLGFIGVGDRGTGLLRITLRFPNVQVPAVCDISQPAATRAQDLVEKALGTRPEAFTKGAQDYRRLLERDDIDGIVLSTPQEQHAEQTIDSFKAGKYVGAEVPAAITIEECWELVRAQQKTGTGYMLLENYLYSQPVMMVQHMADQGVFGDLTYGYGSYIHEIRSMRFDKDGKLTWRGENILNNRGIIYPTHAIGPVARWMGVDGKQDRMRTLVAMDSRSVATQAFAAEKFGPGSEPAKVQFQMGDTNQCLIRTEQGKLIEIRYDTASPRPSGMGEYELQGSKGVYKSAFGQRNVFIEGRSEGHKWEPLEKYQSEFQHPYWKAQSEQAKTTGHGGADWFTMAEFIQAVRTGESPIDIYDAVAWSALRPLSQQSIREGFKPVEFPDFSRKEA